MTDREEFQNEIRRKNDESAQDLEKKRRRQMEQEEERANLEKRDRQTLRELAGRLRWCEDSPLQPDVTLQVQGPNPTGCPVVKIEMVRGDKSHTWMTIRQESEAFNVTDAYGKTRRLHEEEIHKMLRFTSQVSREKINQLFEA